MTQLLDIPIVAQIDQKCMVREKDSFSHAWEIQKPFGIIETVLNWCKNELTGEWRWQLIEISSDKKPGRYCFYFDSERDYLAFMMKWS